MRLITAFFALAGLLLQLSAQAQPPAPGAPLPPLRIEDRGEVLLQGEDFSFAPWSSEKQPGKVHILQYLGATRADSKRFKPFTDAVERTFERGEYHITTIVNLDAALWGTTGLAVSEVKDSKRKYPGSTMVLDESGSGVDAWELGKSGTGLAIMDGEGIVRYFTREPLDEKDLEASVELVRKTIQECLEVC
jgi:YtfJ family uncharacterized protein